MPDEPPKNDPLGLFAEDPEQQTNLSLEVRSQLESDPFEDQPQGEPEEEDPLWKDLLVYDNPEVFRDNTLPQAYHLRIRSAHTPDVPFVLKVEVDGENLPEVIKETLLWIMKQDTSFDGDVAALQSELKTDNDYLETVYSVRQFFVRNLPKLLIHAYNIAIAGAVFYEVGNLMDRRAERERLIKMILKELLRTLEKDVKQMLATRSSGRPSVAEDRMPEIVKQVLRVVRDIMGDAKGKDAVPVLKTVADKLNLTETALRKKLVRARHPWAGIKHFFENEP